MKKWLAVLLACMALGLVVAGCGGDDDDDGGEEVEAGRGAEVGMANIQFEPAELSVSAGDTITFTNNESVPHDVHKTSGPGPDFSSGDTGGMMNGDTFKLTLDEPGSYEYVCNVHAPGMAGTITVK